MRDTGFEALVIDEAEGGQKAAFRTLTLGEEAAQSLGVDVARREARGATDFPIAHLALHCEGGDVEVAVQDAHTVRISAPELADSFVAVGERTDAECLAEELRHLGPDATFERALRGLSGVRRGL